jgi:hypothetical protein
MRGVCPITNSAEWGGSFSRAGERRTAERAAPLGYGLIANAVLHGLLLAFFIAYFEKCSM